MQDEQGLFHLLVVGGPTFLHAASPGTFAGGLTGPLAVFLVH